MQPGESFGRLLKGRRRTLDLTQEDLARQVGCAVITIKRIENEKDPLRPSKQIAELLAEALDIPAGERAAFVRLARATPRTERSPSPHIPAPTPEHRENIDLSGRLIKGYELREQIGAGGFGVVYRAQQTGVGRSVAVKIILPQYANQPDFIRRFESEAQIVVRLEHPHIVPLYDYWREADGAYLVMRYIRGGSLQTALHGTPWALDRITHVLEQIGAALAFAHQLGVVHRDVKPANILLDADGNAYLADFGIAKDLRTAEPDDLTQAGAIVGSPAYLSPEQIRDEPVTPQTDIYSLGIVLYELLAGAHPFADLSPAERLAKQLNEPLPALNAGDTNLSADLDSIIHRATAKRPADRYPSISSLLADWRRISARMSTSYADAALATTAAAITPIVAGSAPNDHTLTDVTRIENPYKGLRAFGAADAADFFGRAALIERLLERLVDDGETSDEWRVTDNEGVLRHPSPVTRHPSRFLAVVGPSGSGKSSVVRAGLLPALRRGGLPGSEQWFIAEMVPGAHPLDELELALLKVAATQLAGLREQLDRDERGLARAARLILADDESELVLVIDQFEELFTLVDDERTRVHFIASLVAAVTDSRSRVRVIVTLRADFYDRPLRYGALGELVRTRTEVVLPLDLSELAQVIVGPPKRVGLEIESGLVRLISRDVGDQPGALPLLQYALTELFGHRDGRTLTLAGYQVIGGVSGALARRADDLYNNLDRQHQEAARQLFLRLVTLGEGVEDTRRRVPRSEISDQKLVIEANLPISSRQSPVSTVLDLYGRYRLLTFDRDSITRQPTVEVAHEALIRAWGRLREWLDASRDDLRVQRRLAAATHEWAQSRHDPSFLAAGARLAQFAALAADSDLALNDGETAYLQASLDERDRQAIMESERQGRELALQKRAANRLRYLVGALALFLVVALGLSVFAFNRQAAAVTNLTRSEAQRLAAEANVLLQARGNAEVIALLSIRSLRSQYTTQGDATLAGAAALDYPVQRFIGHTGPVWAAAYSPDGKYVVTGSNDHTARLWDAQTGAALRTYTGHDDAVSAIAYSPDGKYILTGSIDKTARLWNIQTGAVLQILRGHTDEVTSVAFAPSGNYVLSSSGDLTARLWDVQTGKELRAFDHPDQVLAVAFSPDSKYFLTGSADKIARLWDIETGAELRQFSGHTGLVMRVAFSPDSKYILTGSDDYTARLWDTQTGATLQTLAEHKDIVNGVAYSPDGKYVLTGAQDKTVRLWDAQTGTMLRIFTGHSSFVWDVAFSPNGAYILTGSFDGTARLWNVQAKPQLPLLNNENGVSGVTFSRDGNYILTGSNANIARLWNAQTGAEIREFAGHTGPVGGVAFSPDGRYVLTSSVDKTARLWDLQTGKELRQFIGHINVFNLNTVAFSPDSKYALTGNNDYTARLWDAQSGKQLRVFQHDAEVFSVRFSPDGTSILTGAFDKTARLWEAGTGAQLRVFNIPNAGEGASSAAYAPDGKTILTGSWDGSARIWDAQAGAVLHVLSGHTDIVWAATYSSDGQYALTGSADGTARLWDVQTGQELRRFAGHTATLQGVAFSPDGKQVLTGSLDGTARLWDTDYHDTIRYLCGRLLRDFTDDERAQYGIPNDGPTCPKP